MFKELFHRLDKFFPRHVFFKKMFKNIIFVLLSVLSFLAIAYSHPTVGDSPSPTHVSKASLEKKVESLQKEIEFLKMELNEAPHPFAEFQQPILSKIESKKLDGKLSSINDYGGPYNYY